MNRLFIEYCRSALQIYRAADAGAAKGVGGGSEGQAARRPERADGPAGGRSVRSGECRDGELSAARRLLARLKQYQCARARAAANDQARSGSRLRGGKVLPLEELVLARTGLK